VGGPAEVAVFDASGRRVRTLLSETMAAGRHPLAWDGAEASGVAAPAGVYFVHAQSCGSAVSRRLVRVQ